MEADFSPRPHKEAVALIAGKQPVTKKVFNQLLPELRARAFTVAGISSMDALQRIRDAVSSVPLGANGGQTWDQAKAQIVDELDPYLGDGADYRATLILRTNGFQAFSSSIHNAGMADEDTTHFQYLHGECKVPTPSHLALNGIVLPKDDPFWETHTGPWGHLGCVCYLRPMNPDLVDDEKAKDEKRNPEDRNVITGPALKQLHHGDILRAGVHYDVNIDGPDNSGFSWSPGDFKIPLKELEKRYDPEVWSEFQTWAQKEMLNDNQSVWDWLLSTDKSAPRRKRAAPAQPEPPGKIPEGIRLLAEKFKEAKFSAEMIHQVKALPAAVAPLLENLYVQNAGRSSAFYRRSEKTIHLKRDIKTWSGAPDTMVHEVGHHLHYESGTITENHTAPEFKLAAINDWQKVEDWAAKQIGPDWKDKLKQTTDPYARLDAIKNALGYKAAWPELSLTDQKRISRFGDTIMGLSSGKYGFGHDPSYMYTNGLKEVFTHAWTGLVDKDNEFGSLFSGVTDEVRRVLKL